MSDPSITSLIEKLEQAEVGSRELDVAIWAHLHPDKLKVAEFWPAYVNHSLTAVAFTLPPKRTKIVTRDKGEYVHADPVTTSLDAALALAERVLPGWRMHALQDQQGIYQTDNTATRWAAGISEMRGPGNVLSYAPTPSLAVCASIMKARAQSEARV